MFMSKRSILHTVNFAANVVQIKQGFDSKKHFQSVYETRQIINNMRNTIHRAGNFHTRNGYRIFKLMYGKDYIFSGSAVPKTEQWWQFQSNGIIEYTAKEMAPEWSHSFSRINQ